MRSVLLIIVCPFVILLLAIVLSILLRIMDSYYPFVCVRVRPFWRRKCYGLSWNLSWWSHSAQNCSRNIACRKIQRQYSWSSATLITSFNITMQDVTRLVFVKTFSTRIRSVFFLGRHFHRICHQLNIYGMYSAFVFTTRNTTWAAWRTCAWVEQHPTSLYPTIDWFYAYKMRSCRCCKKWSHTLLNSANLHTAWQFLSVHDLFW